MQNIGSMGQTPSDHLDIREPKDQFLTAFSLPFNLLLLIYLISYIRKRSSPLASYTIHFHKQEAAISFTGSFYLCITLISEILLEHSVLGRRQVNRTCENIPKPHKETPEEDQRHGLLHYVPQFDISRSVHCFLPEITEYEEMLPPASNKDCETHRALTPWWHHSTDSSFSPLFFPEQHQQRVSEAHSGMGLTNSSDTSMSFARWWGFCCGVGFGGFGVFFDILHRTDVVTKAALVNKIWGWSGLGYLGKIV